jgi:hypothetical protein
MGAPASPPGATKTVGDSEMERTLDGSTSSVRVAAERAARPAVTPAGCRRIAAR